MANGESGRKCHEESPRKNLGKYEKLQRQITFCKSLPSKASNNNFLGMYKFNQTIHENIFKKKDE